jgi:hypothetical protein
VPNVRSRLTLNPTISIVVSKLPFNLYGALPLKKGQGGLARDGEKDKDIYGYSVEEGGAQKSGKKYC